jgi:hypothetical protein
MKYEGCKFMKKNKDLRIFCRNKTEEYLLKGGVRLKAGLCIAQCSEYSCGQCFINADYGFDETLNIRIHMAYE